MNIYRILLDKNYEEVKCPLCNSDLEATTIEHEVAPVEVTELGQYKPKNKYKVNILCTNKDCKLEMAVKDSNKYAQIEAPTSKGKGMFIENIFAKLYKKTN